MSYKQLQQCRELERLANELDFDLSKSSFDDLIELKCRKYSPEQDRSGQAVTPYTAWAPYGHRAAIAIGDVSELNMFLLGVRFMKNYVEKVLHLDQQLKQAQEKIFRESQQQVTLDAMLDNQ